MIQEQYLYLVCLILVPHTILGTDEIVTLQTTDRISCVTTDTENPIFVSPPITEVSKHELGLLEIGKWINDDWSTQNASSFLQSSVTDKRWEGFEIINSKFVGVTDVNSFSFSIYTYLVSEIRFLFLNNENFVHPFLLNRTYEKQHDNKWTHFTILLTNQNVYVYEDDEQIHTREDFAANEIIIKTENNTYWKIHDYQFKWANTIQRQDVTTLVIPPTEKPCVMLYITLCEKCVLNVDVASGSKNSVEEIRASDTADSLMVPWQSHKIAVEPDIESIITFHRKKISEDIVGSGHWGIDIRQCPVDKSNKVIRNINVTTVSREKRFCTFLNKQDKDKIPKSNDEQNKTSHCEPGLLGSKCDISCEDVLGFGSPNCGKYRICQNLDCFCAWGYYGELCQKSCTPGTWGVSCKNICDSSCVACNRINGECTIKVIWIILSLFSLMVMTIKMIVYFVIRIKKSRKRVGASYALEETLTSTSVHLLSSAHSKSNCTLSMRKCTLPNRKK